MTTTATSRDGSAPRGAPRASAPRSRLRRSQRRAGIAFALPVIVLELAMLALPIGQAAYYSFTRWDGIQSTWIGLANYQRLFGDPTSGASSSTT